MPERLFLPLPKPERFSGSSCIDDRGFLSRDIRVALSIIGQSDADVLNHDRPAATIRNFDIHGKPGHRLEMIDAMAQRRLNFNPRSIQEVLTDQTADGHCSRHRPPKGN